MRTRDLKLIMLYRLYENKLLPDFNEFHDNIINFFPYWKATYGEVAAWHDIILDLRREGKILIDMRDYKTDHNNNIQKLKPFFAK